MDWCIASVSMTKLRYDIIHNFHSSLYRAYRPYPVTIQTFEITSSRKCKTAFKQAKRVRCVCCLMNLVKYIYMVFWLPRFGLCSCLASASSSSSSSSSMLPRSREKLPHPHHCMVIYTSFNELVWWSFNGLQLNPDKSEAIVYMVGLNSHARLRHESAIN